MFLNSLVEVDNIVVVVGGGGCDEFRARGLRRDPPRVVVESLENEGERRAPPELASFDPSTARGSR